MSGCRVGLAGVSYHECLGSSLIDNWRDQKMSFIVLLPMYFVFCILSWSSSGTLVELGLHRRADLLRCMYHPAAYYFPFTEALSLSDELGETYLFVHLRGSNKSSVHGNGQVVLMMVISALLCTN